MCNTTDMGITPTHCTLCPRACGANRAAGRTGYCGAADKLKVARAALHHWEEPCISGTGGVPDAANDLEISGTNSSTNNATMNSASKKGGSGTVFFSGCTLKCCYCQNYNISAEGYGKEISTARLAEIFLDLQAQGAHNINLVTPGQWQPWIRAALKTARAQGLTLPIACNTGGYETTEWVATWQGDIDIWLVDYKYADSALAAALSAAPDYPEVAHAAITAMLQQAGTLQFDTDGILQKGTIVRHLTLPNHTADSFAVLDALDALNKAFPQHFLPSLMSQYTPFYKASEHGIGRRITSYEYRKVINYAMDKGLTSGYMQEKSSAKEEYTPLFDCTGV